MSYINTYGFSLFEIVTFGTLESYDYKRPIQTHFAEKKCKHKVQRKKKAEKKRDKRLLKKEQKKYK